jgi:hypothetical protein
MGGSPCRVVVGKEQTLQKGKSNLAMPRSYLLFYEGNVTIGRLATLLWYPFTAPAEKPAAS